jgi:hypothetical protein
MGLPLEKDGFGVETLFFFLILSRAQRARVEGPDAA